LMSERSRETQQVAAEFESLAGTASQTRKSRSH
jgi:hypothetical protein